jgi:outer membrane protein TolC
MGWTQLALLVSVLAQAAPWNLDDCLRHCLANHPDLRVAESGVAGARARQRIARSTYLPRLSVESSDSQIFIGRQDAVYVDGSEVPYERDAYSDDLHGFGIHLRQPVFDGLAYWHRPRQAAAELDRAELDVELTREQLVVAVIEAYYRLLGQRRVEQVLVEALAVSRAQLELARERHRLGAASKVDVSRARLAVGEDRIALERQRMTAAQGRAALNQAMGREPGAALELREEQGAGGVPAAALEPRLAEDNRRLRRNRLDEAIAEREIEIAAAGLWPTVTASAAYTRQDPEFYKVYSRFDQLYRMTLSVGISFPIFEGFATQGRIEAAEAELERVRAERNQLRRQLETDLFQARTEVRQLTAVLAIQRDNIRAAEHALELAREQYRLGQGTALEVRDAQLAVRRTRVEHIQTRYDLRIALAVYHRARGDLLQTYLPGVRP